ncbi:hypothetical protein FHT02_001702 [Sphingomonas xinjiangensis]|uniref:Uncharacterized protein n=1 Tax=Sphingomonas xinjiangensis TaxID=643568 RepID=A0A840YPV2_9SPHN|nr:hypothetical protein [Sphingomonas xinjiangensis]
MNDWGDTCAFALALPDVKMASWWDRAKKAQRVAGNMEERP